MAVSVVIPAFNEENTVGQVVEIVKLVDLVKEIIVVSDGSTDATAVAAAAAGASVIRLEENQGKGGAMMLGCQHARQDIILFLDADLIGIQAVHIFDLVAPILEGQADMTVGVFDNGRIATDLAHVFASFLSGQRAVRRSFLAHIDSLESSRFGIEVVLTRYFHEHNLRVQEVVLKELSHVMKEEKMGLRQGFLARMKMYWEIARTFRIGYF